MELSILFPADSRVPSVPLQGRAMTHLPYPSRKRTAKARREALAAAIIETKPDLIHVFGTEGNHAWDVISSSARGRAPVVVSVQGLVSVIAEHYLSGVPDKVIRRQTFRDLVRRDGLRAQQRGLRRQGEVEVRALRGADRIIGRTQWDMACASRLAPRVPYETCNENLRDQFLRNEWHVDECIPHRIFITQGYYPIKGLHRLLDALAILVESFPDVSLHVAGSNPLRSTAPRDVRRSTYALHLKELITTHSLRDRVIFLGPLGERDMVQEYLDAHVHVVPSSIENSSNSLGEGLSLGVPTVASYVGGNPDFLHHGTNGFLYASDAPYMLAHYISTIFRDNSLSTRFSRESRTQAAQIFDPIRNTARLVDIYHRAIAEPNPFPVILGGV